MMLDFQPVREKQVSLQDLVRGLNKNDLRRELDAMYAEVERLIADCTDAEVTFIPTDNQADDPYAVDGEENLAWTLAHVIVHITASMEESASIASELARGVEFHGRSRYEVPWRTVTGIGQCQARMKESHRMCLASLELWPEPPHVENTYTPQFPGALPHTCISRFASGLQHTSDHLGQITAIILQARRKG
jgi:hypothetical protein